MELHPPPRQPRHRQGKDDGNHHIRGVMPPHHDARPPNDPGQNHHPDAQKWPGQENHKRQPEGRRRVPRRKRIIRRVANGRLPVLPRPVKSLLHFLGRPRPPRRQSRAIGQYARKRRGQHRCHDDADPLPVVQLPRHQHPRRAHQHEIRPVPVPPHIRVELIIRRLVPLLPLAGYDRLPDRPIIPERHKSRPCAN